MFQTFISRHNSNFFSDKLVLTSVTPASSAPVLQTPKATSSTLYFDSLTRSEERFSRNAETDLVCRLLLEKKKQQARRERLVGLKRRGLPPPGHNQQKLRVHDCHDDVGDRLTYT